jgi:K+-sensing histidine kinase KdpD
MELALLAERSAAECRATLEQAFQLAGDLAHLVAALRELADAAAPGGVPGRVLLGAVVSEAVEELRGLAESRGVEAVLADSKEVPVWVPPERLRQAVLKLLHHAIQSSPEKGVIGISLSTSDGRVCVTVKVPGQVAGRSRGDPGRPYLQGRRKTPDLGQRFSDAAKESSLEWAIAQTLVEGMGGTLQVDQGTPSEARHCLCLPLPEQGAE